MNDFGLRGLVYAMWFFLAVSVVSCGGCVFQAIGLRLPIHLVWVGW